MHAADSASDLKILVGLGNPGGEYANTRHNLGTQFINLLADQNGIVFDERHRHAIVGSGEICGNKVVLAKLKTYMNDSGNGITFLLNHYSASPSDMTIICDEYHINESDLMRKAILQFVENIKQNLDQTSRYMFV